ncbi:DUF1513 domain-containing protein [Rubrimonas cliftonensis]|uniref:Twin-arginine translocation pathway signal n=1 Tax=Rubrimonas cliftonensis TaxID=89524 RepID=A0A1H4F0S4_9RHOB|nr:DUF1513 domain-containing protein [Rubrimonas cliftonensis]SEA90448.1 hypothetical protein SAMN05444370_11726 [Rubrimonas cliftonensis]
MGPGLGLTRRALLAGAAAIAAKPGWADAGGPAWLSAALRGRDDWRLIGLRPDGGVAFDLALPGRGHAAAAHPAAPLAVAFARRPGAFALVIDCAEGVERARLTAPPERAFSGHGAFSADGALLFSGENAHDLGRGRIGVWDATDWRRIGEFDSGGIGPHEILRAPDGASLIVANGGILTHPDSGRQKLNLPTMRPNLARLRMGDGALIETVEPEPALRLNSLRHLAVAPDGTVAVAAQWQGDLRAAPPLAALWRPGAEGLDWLGAPEAPLLRMRGYAGSVAIARDGTRLVATGPRGGLALVFDIARGFKRAVEAADVCGAAPAGDGFALTDGAGRVLTLGDGSAKPLGRIDGALDNHLVAL